MRRRSLLPVLFLALGAGRATAQPFTEVDPGVAQPPFPCVVWGDYDGDGDLDELVAGVGSHDIAFSTLYKNIAGAFANSGVVLLGLSRSSAAWGDFDGDGDLDLAMTGLTTAGVPTTRIYRNDAATFTALAGTPLGVLGGNVAWGDYDGDGDLDLLVTGVTSTVPAIGVASTRLYRNDSGSFTSVTHPFPNCYLGSAAWGDYDKDGKLDLVLTGTSENGALFAGMWRNDGGGLFTRNAGAALPGTDLGFAAWGDYDMDGDLDLLFGGNSNDGFIARIYRNDAGVFTDANAGLLGVLWAAGAWGDADCDGDLDAMVMGYDAVAQVPRTILYRNDAGSFVNSGTAFHDLYLGNANWTDFDNDGDLDLQLAGNGAGFDLIRHYRNDSVVANAAPTAPANLAAHTTNAHVVLSWTAASDDHTPAAGLSYNLRLGTTPGGSQIVSPQSAANGYRRLAALGNASSNLEARVSNLQPGTYFWSVQSVDASFVGSPFAAEGSFSILPTDAGDAEVASSPSLRVAPNPFTHTMTLNLTGAGAVPAQVAIFDVAGRLVRELWSGRLSAAGQTATWDSRDASGRDVPAGIYVVRLRTSSEVRTERLVKLR